jgi:cell division protein FtsX
LEINIYLEDDITQLQKDNIYNTLLLNENVADITYQSKEAALEDFKESLGTDNVTCSAAIRLKTRRSRLPTSLKFRMPIKYTMFTSRRRI